ncbi:hypothetical protein FNH22_12055 [Fulvivirga sp. M361]|uniref:hypothetical protein n=1 Tax=Fulvivirga sp. M361 TaxID=2594266 RepID=UPI001179BD47|nr:hypothetical protein [Fulvivirga sp. M361]TRX58608.1 hypothetical protein FNH22_12055 [Fulvivirga sp. M361]
MEKIKSPIVITTLFLVFYTLSPYVGLPYPFVFASFLTVNVLTIWMVLSILKKGTPSKKTFEEKWYEDVR